MSKRRKRQKRNPQSEDEKPDLSNDFDDDKGEDMAGPVIFRNAEEIARYIDTSRNNIPHLVSREGLPARKIRNKWKANICDVRGWLIDYVRRGQKTCQ